MIKEFNSCRLCGCKSTKLVFDWGKSPLANKFKSSPDSDEKEFPLRYFKCEECHSVQIKDELSSEELFADYLYETPPNLLGHFQEFVSTTSQYLKLKDRGKVLDIGSNNGLLLGQFKSKGYLVCGFEPAEKIAKKAEQAGVPTIADFFNKKTANSFVVRHGPVDLITCTNAFAHLSDLNGFVEALKTVMHSKSYFVFENAYLLDTIKNIDIGQAYFEHFYMHSIYPLKKLFSKHGLELFKVEYNNVQMGSIRCYVRFPENDFLRGDGSIEKAIETERSSGLYKSSAYSKMMKKVGYIKTSLLKHLKKSKNEGKTISVYGWPAKMTLLSKFFGLDKYVSYVIEESAVKVGKYCPGNRLNIRDLQYFKENPTDICILGAYNFEKDIKSKNLDYKGEWINPLQIYE